MEHRGDHPVHSVHRPHQLDLRLHDLLRTVMGLQLLGSDPCVAVSNRLVRRVIDDANAHYSHHSYQQDPVPAKPGELDPDHHDNIDHGLWHVAAVFTCGFRIGIHAPAAALLANSATDIACLCGSYAGH